MARVSAEPAVHRSILPDTPHPGDGLGTLLDLALEATAATGAALVVPSGEGLHVVATRGANAPLVDEAIPLAGSTAAEALACGRLVIGAEPPPRGRQGTLWQEDRSIDVMAAPVLLREHPIAALVLYHRHLGSFRRGDATTLGRLATLAGAVWAGSAAAPPLPDARSGQAARAAARAALVAATRLTDTEAHGELVQAATGLFAGASVRLSLLDGEELVCRAATGRLAADVGRRRSKSFGVEGMALESPEGVLASEWTPEAGTGGGSGGARSLLAVPLRRMDQLFGVLTVVHEEPGRLVEADREALLQFAVHAAAALSELRLARAIERQRADRGTAHAAAAAIAGAADLPTLRRTIVLEALGALAADAAALAEPGPEGLAVTATEGDSALVPAPLVAEGRLRCGHELPGVGGAHRCRLPESGGHLLAVRLGDGTGQAGLLVLLRSAPAFTALDRELLQRIAEVAGMALLAQRSNLRVGQHADRLRSVADVSASMHQSLRPEDALCQAADLLRRALGVGTIRVGLVDEVWQEIAFPIDRRGEAVHDGERRPLGRGLLEEVWRTGRTVFFPANALEEISARGFTVETRPRCFAAAPLRTRGTLTGVLAIEDEARDHAFEAEDVRILEIVAHQLGVTLENLDGLEEERRQRITAEWLRRMARSATDAEASPTRVLELAADAAFQGVGGTGALVSTPAGDATRLIAASRGVVPPGLAAHSPLGGTVDGWMREEQGAVFISADLARDPRLEAEVRQRAAGVALAGIPIWCDHQIIAVLQLVRRAGESFTVAEVERLAQIADHAGAACHTATAGQGLRKAEERYRRLLAAASDAIFTLDPGGAILSLNQAAEHLWNVPAQAAIGREWQAVLPLADATTVRREVQRVLGGESLEFETGFHRAGGERGMVALSLSPLVEEGVVTAVLGIVRDVTKARRAQAQALQAEKMAAIGNLIGGLAHEINNPLAGILVNVELLADEVRDPAQLDSLHAIRVEADRAAQIVRDLLLYVRGQGAEHTVLDLRDVARGALALRRGQLRGALIEVNPELPTAPVLVRGNRGNLQQMLLQLLGNAEHAIRRHRGRGQIWLRLGVEAGQAVLTVEDDGPGIPAESLSRIFDPFYTTSHEGEGAGLGLAVSAGIVTDHRGQVSASERPGGGAQFVVTLPLAGAEPERRIAPVERPREAPAPSPGAARGCILLVDDEPDLRRSIAKFLTRSGWEVDLADSGEEGIRLLQGRDYQAVLCDLRMPGMSGHEFYRWLQDRQSPAIERLIFMTGDVVSPDASRFLLEAGRPVLSKPFGLRDLMDALAQVLPGA